MRMHLLHRCMAPDRLTQQTALCLGKRAYGGDDTRKAAPLGLQSSMYRISPTPPDEPKFSHFNPRQLWSRVP